MISRNERIAVVRVTSFCFAGGLGRTSEREGEDADFMEEQDADFHGGNVTSSLSSSEVDEPTG